MKRSIRLFIDDICLAMDKIIRYTSDMTYETFAADSRTSDAVLRCLEIIGEAAKNVPESIRNAYPGVPWRQMAGMRDKISHDYFGVQLKTVWKVVAEDIPGLCEQVKNIRAQMPKEIE